MGRLNNFKIWVFNKFDIFIKVSEIDKLREEIDKKGIKYEELKKSYFNAEGKKKTLENKINEMKITLEEVKVASKKLKEKNDEVNLKKLFVSKKNIEKEISMYEETLAMTTKMATELYDRKTEMETYLNELKHKINQLKIKDEYSKQANNFLSVMNDINKDDSFKISEDIINTEFNSAEFQIEDYKSNPSVESLISNINQNEEFEKFKREL